MFNQCCTTIPKDKLNRCMSVKQLLEAQDELNKNLPAGEAWHNFYSVDHMTTAIISELGEMLDQTGIAWKHWKYGPSHEEFSREMLKLEMSDIVHFWLSIAIIMMRGPLSESKNFCPPEDEWAMYEKVYVGDGDGVSGVAIYNQPNILNHQTFVHIARIIICGQRDMDAYSWVNTLGVLAASVGMSCEELSAYMASKTVLNKVRWLHPDWQKIDDHGKEDNERMFEHINAWLKDKDQTLDDLRSTILMEFYGQEAL